MSVQQVQLFAAGVSTPIPIDLKMFKFGVGLLVNIPTGVSATYNVQVSGDKKTSPLGVWNLHDVLQAMNASANNSLAYPVAMVRLQVLNTNSSILPITLSVVQVSGSI